MQQICQGYLEGRCQNCYRLMEIHIYSHQVIIWYMNRWIWDLICMCVIIWYMNRSIWDLICMYYYLIHEQIKLRLKLICMSISVSNITLWHNQFYLHVIRSLYFSCQFICSLNIFIDITAIIIPEGLQFTIHWIFKLRLLYSNSVVWTKER